MAKFSIKEAWSFTKEMFSSFGEDNVMSKSAALSYYTVFSLAPILVIIITVAGFFIGKEAMQAEVTNQLTGLMGKEAATQLQTMMENTTKSGAGTLATIISIVTLVIGATGVFGELKTSLNTIWEVKAKPKNGIWALVKDRLLSFAMVLSLGFILLITLAVNAGVALVVGYFARLLPEVGEVALQAANLVISVAVTTVLFGLVFKGLPDVKIRFADVWKGALFTAILFAIGKFLIGLYIGQSNIGSTYGAAGSLVIVFLWVYYSSVIFFLGAEFTYVYALRYGSRIVPTENAVHVKQVEENTSGALSEAQSSKRPYSYSPQQKP